MAGFCLHANGNRSGVNDDVRCVDYALSACVASHILIFAARWVASGYNRWDSDHFLVGSSLIPLTTRLECGDSKFNGLTLKNARA